MHGRQRWRDLGVEGVVIVASILLAFALDAWWDSRAQRQEEGQVLENLRTDFQAAGSQLDRYLLVDQTTLTSIEAILRSVRAARAAGDARVDVATVDLARTLIAPTFDPRTGSLDGLLASGRLGILRNENLRQRLSAWPGLLADASEEEARSDDLIRNQMEPILWKQMDTSPARTLPIEITEEACADILWGRSCEDFDVEVELPARWANSSSVPASLEVLGVFSTRLMILAHGVIQLRSVREEIDHILDEIEESHGR
jgi:hypothetical protein